MGLSWVTAIDLNANNTITLHVRVDGFEPGKPVEISGYATQTNGAVGTFYDIQRMPAVAGPANMDVINVRPAGTGFAPGLPFTVVARAADVWITNLASDLAAPLIGEIRAAWSSPANGYDSALSPAKSASLAAPLSFQPLPPLQRLVRNPFPAIPGSLGPLAGLAGKWSGQGFNVIWRPRYGPPPGYFLELNLTSEQLEFTPIRGPIPNRGLLQPDINMFGLTYLQQISDVNVATAVLHIEPGLWVVIPATRDPKEVATVARLASIPHGTAILAQGTAEPTRAGPNIPDISIKPFQIGKPDATSDLPEQNLNGDGQFRTSGNGLNDIDQGMVDNPNSFLRSTIAGQQISDTITLQVATDDTPVPGGGTANTAFLKGAGNGPNADAVSVSATFWLETIQGDPCPSQLQYSQTALLNFAGKSWPHVTVGTLHKVG